MKYLLEIKQNTKHRDSGKVCYYYNTSKRVFTLKRECADRYKNISDAEKSTKQMLRSSPKLYSGIFSLTIVSENRKEKEFVLK